MGELTPLLLLAAMLLLFWLVVIRPARRQQSTVSELQRNLAVGDRVVLSAGIFGTIVELEDSRVRLEIAPGTVIEVARQVGHSPVICLRDYAQVFDDQSPDHRVPAAEAIYAARAAAPRALADLKAAAA